MVEQPAFRVDLMSEMTFFRQARVDGGIQTGINLGPETTYEQFEITGEEYDPILVWSIDLRCNGPELPKTPEDARAWLLDHGPQIQSGFEQFANQLRFGSDPTGDLLLEWSEFPDPPAGVEMKIVCGAMRRVDGLQLSAHLAELGQHWSGIIQTLEPMFHEAL